MTDVVVQRLQKNTCCSYCGAAFEPDSAWPRTCLFCENITYLNPLPVSVMLVPVEEDGLLLVRRAIEPCRGQVALPGGFMGLGETWQEAGVRELREETGIVIPAHKVTLFGALTSPNGHLLVFGRTPPISAADVPGEFPADETEELVIAREPVPLAFPLHNQAALRFWSLKGRSTPGDAISLGG